MRAFKKVLANLGINDSNRIENFNKYLKLSLNNSLITISELIIRFLQFESIYNKPDNLMIEDITKHNDIIGKVQEIQLIKCFYPKIFRICNHEICKQLLVSRKKRFWYNYQNVFFSLSFKVI